MQYKIVVQHIAQRQLYILLLRQFFSYRRSIEALLPLEFYSFDFISIKRFTAFTSNWYISPHVTISARVQCCLWTRM